MLLKYVLLFILINSQLTFSIAANVKRHRKSNNGHHAKVKKNKHTEELPQSIQPTEDTSDAGDLEWLSESTKTRNVLMTKSKKESSSVPPKTGMDTRDTDKQLADYKASKQAEDLISKMSLKRVMVKEIMEVDKVYETGSTEIIINPKDLWNEKNSNQPAMKVVQYMFEKPTTTPPNYETIDIKVYESLKTVEATFSPNNKVQETSSESVPVASPPPPPPPPVSNNNKVPPRRKRPHASRKPTIKPLDFDEFLKVIFGNYGGKKEPKERDEVQVETESKVDTDTDDDEESLKVSLDTRKNDDGAKQPSSVDTRSKIVQTRNPSPTPTTQRPCDDDEEEVETTVEETNTSVVATKFVEEVPEDFEVVEKTVGKRSKVKRTSAAGDSSPKAAKRMAANKKKTKACRKKRLEQEVEVVSFETSADDMEGDFSTSIVYTINEYLDK